MGSYPISMISDQLLPVNPFSRPHRQSKHPARRNPGWEPPPHDKLRLHPPQTTRNTVFSPFRKTKIDTTGKTAKALI